jgi:hypothetical protein
LVAADDAGTYVASPALVAVTEHVPALVAESALPLIAQPLAVPLLTVYVTAPVPEPPLVVSVKGVPTVPVTLVTARAA